MSEIDDLEQMIGALTDTLNASVTNMAKAVEPLSKTFGQLGNTISKTAQIMSRAMSGIDHKASQYAEGQYAPETEAEKELLEHIIVANIMES